MLTEQLSVSSWQDVILAAGEEMESILYANRDGMYHYSFSGSVVEQVIDGSFCSMSSPAVTLMDLAWGRTVLFMWLCRKKAAAIWKEAFCGISTMKM